MEDTFGALSGVAMLAIVIISALWVITPFLILGINKRLDKLNKNIAKIGRLLKDEIEHREVEGN